MPKSPFRTSDLDIRTSFGFRASDFAAGVVNILHRLIMFPHIFIERHGTRMDHQLASWMNASDEAEELGPSVRFLDRANGKIEVSGLASPFSVLRYVLAPLEELYGQGTGEQNPDPTSEALAPLLLVIQQTIVEGFEDDPRLHDARVGRALTRLIRCPEGNFAVFGLTAAIQAALRLTLSL